MGRQKKFKKMKLPPFLEDFKSALVEKFVLGLVVIFAIVISILFVKTFLYRSDYFRLRIVETRGDFLDQAVVNSMNNELLKIHRGRNVFTINLKGIERSIQTSYPDAKDVSARIALPDRLSISLKFRKPVAVVNAGKYYPIDEDGFVLPRVDAGSLKDLPVIFGVDINSETRRGARPPSKSLELAIELIKSIRRFKSFAEYGVNTIDARDAKNLIFFLKTGTEVRIGCEGFGERLEQLMRTLRDPRLVLPNIKYIDLRFKDVVIGPK